MSELDDLERDLLEASSVWFSQHLHLKLQRLIAIARWGERVMLAQQHVQSGDRHPLTDGRHPLTGGQKNPPLRDTDFSI